MLSAATWECLAIAIYSGIRFHVFMVSGFSLTPVLLLAHRCPGISALVSAKKRQMQERRELETADGGRKALCYAKPVHIGSDCWFGASVTVCPGVTIGDGCVIGAGAVVTRDIPPRTFAAGVPCRVVRELTDADSMRNKSYILADNRVID